MADECLGKTVQLHPQRGGSQVDLQICPEYLKDCISEMRKDMKLLKDLKEEYSEVLESIGKTPLPGSLGCNSEVKKEYGALESGKPSDSSSSLKEDLADPKDQNAEACAIVIELQHFRKSLSRRERILESLRKRMEEEQRDLFEELQQCLLENQKLSEKADVNDVALQRTREELEKRKHVVDGLRGRLERDGDDTEELLKTVQKLRQEREERFCEYDRQNSKLVEIEALLHDKMRILDGTENSLEEEVEIALKKSDAMQDALHSLSVERSCMVREIQELRQSSRELSEDLGKCIKCDVLKREQAAELLLQMTFLRYENAMTNERNKNLQARLETLLRKDRQQSRRVEEVAAHFPKMSDLLSAEAAELRISIERGEADLSCQRIRSDIRKLEGSILSAEKSLSEQRKHLKQREEESRTVMGVVEKQVAKRQDELRLLRERISGAEKSMAEGEALICEERENVARLEEDLPRLREELERKQLVVQDTGRTKDSCAYHLQSQVEECCVLRRAIESTRCEVKHAEEAADEKDEERRWAQQDVCKLKEEIESVAREADEVACRLEASICEVERSTVRCCEQEEHLLGELHRTRFRTGELKQEMKEAEESERDIEHCVRQHQKEKAEAMEEKEKTSRLLDKMRVENSSAEAMSKDNCRKKEAIRDLQNQMEAAAREKTIFEAVAVKLEDQLSRIQSGVVALQRKVRKAEQAASRQKCDAEALDRRHEALRRRIGDLERTACEFGRLNDSLRKQIAEQVKETERLEEKHRRLSQEERRLSDALQSHERKDGSVCDMSRRVRELEEELDDVADLREQLQEASQMKLQLEESMRNSSHRFGMLKTRYEATCLENSHIKEDIVRSTSSSVMR